MVASTGTFTVKLSANAKGRGKLVIEFAGLDQLDGIVERLRRA